MILYINIGDILPEENLTVGLTTDAALRHAALHVALPLRKADPAVPGGGGTGRTGLRLSSNQPRQLGVRARLPSVLVPPGLPLPRPLLLACLAGGDGVTLQVWQNFI